MAVAFEHAELQEYEVTWRERPLLPGAPAAYQAPNRVQNLRTYFYPEGICVVPRTEPNPSWVFGLDLVGYGRLARPTLLSDAVVTVSGNRVAYDRGDLVEWFENRPEGLKHGFLLERRPAAEGPVVIQLQLTGDLGATLDGAGGLGLSLAGRDAPVLRYDGLSVFDAAGRGLPARLALQGDHLQMVLDDQRAIYPVTVDPVLTAPSWTAEGDQISTYFGASVASAGDVNNDGFDDVLISAYGYDAGEPREGRVFLYHGSAAGLASVADWSADGGQADAWFGYSVASAGDVNNDSYDDVVVGAQLYDTAEPNEGRAFLYMGSASGLSTTPAWTAEQDAPDIGGSSASALFGYSVASAGDVNGDGFADVIVGAPGYGNDRTNEGRTFLYHGSAAGLSPSVNWTTEADQEYARFGNSVASAGDVNNDGFDDVIVGAYVFDAGIGGLTFAQDGAAFFYLGSASGLSTEAAWSVQSAEPYARYGVSVASAGDVNNDGYADVIVGAFLHEAGEEIGGRAFLYHGSAAGLSVTASWTAEGDQDDAWFGYSVASAGDVNDDGYADVIVGAPGFDAPRVDEGRAFLYHGSAAGLSTTTAWIAEGDRAHAWLGYSVASAGDVNGDDLADMVVGAPDPYLLDPTEADVGRAFLFYGPGLAVAVEQSNDATDLVEGGATDTYDLLLAVQPSDDVTVTLSPDSQITVSPTLVTFTSTNWNTPQTVTVRAVDDGAFEGEHFGTVAHSVSSADSRYDGVRVASVTAKIADNEVPPDTTDPTVGLTTPADGAILQSTSVTVEGTASDDVAVEGVELSTDGTTWIPATGISPWSGTLTLVEGSNTIYVRATDASGNTATTSIMVTVTLPPPVPPQWSLELIALIAVLVLVAVGVAVALSFLYLRKMRGP